jgi:hypothetical protein
MPDFSTDELFIIDAIDQTKKTRVDNSSYPTATILRPRFQAYSAGLPMVGDGTTGATNEMERLNLTGQSGSQTGPLLNAGSLAGSYVVHYTLSCTTADVTAGTIKFQVDYTDDVGATNQVSATLILTGTGRTRGSFDVYQASGNMTWTLASTGVPGSSLYACRARVVYLGP